MPEDCYAIWGSAGHARVLASLIALQGNRVVATFDQDPSAVPLPHVPLFIGHQGFDLWLDQLERVDLITGLVAIGGSRGSDRLAIHSMFASRGLSLAPLIHPTASVCKTATIGRGTQVLAQAVVAPDVWLGESCIINHRASVDHECQLGDGVHIAPGAILCGLVVCDNCVFVGAGAIILPRLTIGLGAVIGAGAVVTKNVPAGATVVGNPARII